MNNGTTQKYPVFLEVHKLCKKAMRTQKHTAYGASTVSCALLIIFINLKNPSWKATVIKMTLIKQEVHNSSVALQTIRQSIVGQTSQQ